MVDFLGAEFTLCVQMILLTLLVVLLCQIAMDYIDVVMDYIDVTGCIKDKNYFHSLPTSSREFFTLCVRILGIIAKEKAPHEKDV